MLQPLVKVCNSWLTKPLSGWDISSRSSMSGRIGETSSWVLIGVRLGAVPLDVVAVPAEGTHVFEAATGAGAAVLVMVPACEGGRAVCWWGKGGCHMLREGGWWSARARGRRRASRGTERVR